MKIIEASAMGDTELKKELEQASAALHSFSLLFTIPASLELLTAYD